MSRRGPTLPITCKPSSKIGAPTPVGKVRPVLTVVPGGADADYPRGAGGSASLIDEIVREGARRMLAEALQAEVDAYIAAFAGERRDHGRSAASPPVTCPGWTTSTCGPTASTSTSASRSTSCACSC